ncbi:class I SAM-dependent methyltransferase [Patescibacteria group bacterium]
MNSDKNIDLYSKKYFLTEESGHNLFAKNEIQERFRNTLSGVEFSPKDKVLDLGAGRGEIGLLLKNMVGSIVLTDYSDDALEIIRSTVGGIKNVTVEKTNAKSIPYPPNTFDKVFFLEVIEHLYPHETQQVLGEIARVLKPGGSLILSTGPNKYLSAPQYFIAEKIFGLELKTAKYHLNEFSYFSLRKALSKYFAECKISCNTEKEWFYNVISSVSVPNWVKKSVRVSNRVYDAKFCESLRSHLKLEKFLAHCFHAVATKK